MLIAILRYLQGYLKVVVSGYSPERFLNLCKNKKIEIWGLESSHNAYKMYMKISGFRKLKPILKKTKTKVTIEERLGMPFFFYRYRKRNLFFGGIFLCSILVYVLTFFVWKIDIQGNSRITNEVLIEYLETKQICHGMLKKRVDCAQISKDIRKDFDDIIWVSVYKAGTHLNIHIKENEDTYVDTPEEEEPCDLISDKAGIVVDIVTRSGVPQVQIGSQVEVGDVLISGTVDVLNDAKETIVQHTVVADGDVIIETNINYEEQLSKIYYEKQYTKRKKKSGYLRIKDSIWNLNFWKKSYEKNDRKTEEIQLKIGENFYLPIYVGKKVRFEYKLVKKEYSQEEMETILKMNFQEYCNDLEKKGVVISNKELYLFPEENGIKASSTLIMQEEVGIRRKIVDF